MKSILAALCATVCLCSQLRAQLIAEVYTSAGNFSFNLEYVNAERTVANFMRLAQGTQPWLDEKNGGVRVGVPFYNGLRFHKIVDLAPPFSTGVRKYIQAGARYPGDALLQEDSQGAGYHVRDEIRLFFNGTPVLPHTAYAVSMANTGPHSSSSQFLITRVNDPEFDYKNSAFGYVNQQFITYTENNIPVGVSNGRAVVDAIHTSSGPVTISRINFRRLDAGAIAFDENSMDAAGELPVLANPAIVDVHHGPTQVTLTSSPLFSTEVRLYTSIDLENWFYAPLFKAYTTPGIIQSAQISLDHNNFPQAFFGLAGVSYPFPAAPANLLGNTIFVGKNTPDSIRFIFDANGINPIYHRISDGATGALTYTYTPLGPYRGDLEVNTPGLPHRIYRLFFGGTEVAQTDFQDMACQIVDLTLLGPPVTDRTFTISSP